VDHDSVLASHGFVLQVAESYYLDMLRDDARNEAYQDGIRRAIQALEQQQGRAGGVHVLDIGTGSGLLAMMACAAGAGDVTACECFAPVARCAAQCIADNGLEERITLVAKASTEMTQEDMRGGRRAHLLVCSSLC
jgi:protein arginine N-methyltransferase 7